jgi:hypothetical protein
MRLFNPACDQDGVGARFKGRTMLAQLGIALGDLALRVRVRVRPGVVGLIGFFEFTHGRRERDGVELAGQPPVWVR